MATLRHSHPTLTPAKQSWTTRAGAFLFRYQGDFPFLILMIALLIPGTASLRQWGVGVLLIAIGETWRLYGIAATSATSRHRHVQRLITYGAYAWSRNPLYSGSVLVWIGFALFSGVTWFLPVAAFAFGISYTLIVRYEEGVLEGIFGRDYLAYKARTPRWIPRAPTASVVGDYDWPQAWKSQTSTFLRYAALLTAFIVKTILEL
jgi:protein-S-isoprenylcysteine O-methyltransferase Ste14